MATTTTRLGLRKPDPDPFTGDYVSAGDDLNDNWDNIDGKIPFTVCTSGTRPGSPYDGQPIRETDTLDAYVWDAANTKWVRLFIEDHTTAWPETIVINRASTGLGALQVRIGAEASRRWEVNSEGQMFWGDGTASPDTNLYRSAANTLKTDDALVVAGAFTPSVGYLFKQRVIFTASGTFTKASYTGLRAVKAICVGGGGGGGGTAATAGSTVAAAGGGGGGGYTEKWILAASLASSETVTVGAAGTAGSAGANDGGTGGTSSFGAFCSASGGGGGEGIGASSSSVSTAGGAGGTGTGGDLNLTGAYGGYGHSHVNVGYAANGGDSPLGWGVGGRPSGTNGGGGAVAPPADSYGGGGGAAFASFSQSAFAGSAGSAGIVIVDVYV